MFRSLLPILLVILLATVGATAWIVYRVMHPHPKPYLVTPEKFTQLSARGVKATEETWPNHDGTRSRGWLLRGSEGAPAVVLLHKYESDRSWLLNLGVKLNEQTNFTVLWPDMRGHGENPPVKSSALGFKEGDDAAAAIEYLRTLKTPAGRMVVGQTFGIYGCELGAYAALRAAEKDTKISALALDSVPAGPDEIIRLAVSTQMDIDNKIVKSLAKLGMQAWLMGSYDDRTSCTLASGMTGKSVILLSGDAAGPLRDSTVALVQCIPQPANKVEVQSSLPLTGFNLHPSTGQQEEAYDRRVIDFFDRALSAAK
jgi:pimeloyl-ACP methyl ester carboxylesterase